MTDLVSKLKEDRPLPPPLEPIPPEVSRAVAALLADRAERDGYEGSAVYLRRLAQELWPETRPRVVTIAGIDYAIYRTPAGGYTPMCRSTDVPEATGWTVAPWTSETVQAILALGRLGITEAVDAGETRMDTARGMRQ